MAAAPDITTLPRRNVLRLASAPAALLAFGALAPVPTAASTSEVFAKADEVRRLKVAKDAAYARYAALDEEHDRRRGPRPDWPDDDEIADACARLIARFPEITPAVDEAVLALRLRTEASAKARRDEWNEKSDRIAVALGTAKADAAADELYNRLDDAVEALAGLRALTLPELIAKADVFAIVDRRFEDGEGEFPTSHEHLIVSVLRDLSALGTQMRGA